MGVPAGLNDMLDSRLAGVARVQVNHLRRWRFRWFSLVELAFGLAVAVVFFVCLLVALILVVILGEGEFDGESVGTMIPTPRFFAYWHELQVRFLDKEGNVLAEHALQPKDRGEGEGVLGSVLNAAAREGLVVVESLGDSPRETLEVWYGGQPLLAHPERRDEETCAAELRKRGWTVELDEEHVELRRAAKPVGKLGAFFSLCGNLVLLPVLFWQADYRARLRRHGRNVTGVAPRQHRIRIDRQAIEVETTRAGEALFEHRVDARDLIGVAASPTLDYDREVTRRPAHLRLHERSHAVEIPKWIAASGKLVRDQLIVSAQRLWTGLPGTNQRPTRCSYCGNTYVFAPGVTCDSCGAPPDRL